MQKIGMPWLALNIASLLLFSTSPELAQYANNEPVVTFAAEVPLLDCDGVPCIEARTVDGKSWKLGIDTGNDNSVIDSRAAQAAELKPTKPTPKGWPAEMFITALPALKIGDATLYDVQMVAMNFSGEIAKGTMPHVDGTLAYTAFKNRYLQLDFAARVLRISEPLAETVDCGKLCDKISLITFGKQGPPIVVARGFEINGKSVTAQVDTMYTGSLLVYTASIDKLGLSEAAKTTETRKFLLTDGGVNMKVAPAKRESFHGLTLAGAAPKVYFPTEGVHEPDGLFDATVGLELFQNMIVTFDLHGMNLILQKGRPA
jgi:Aspartyl protease